MTKAAVETAIDQGIHRFLADGVHYRDLMDIRAAAPDWKAWPETWSTWAAEAEKRGEAALALNTSLTAATEFARASLYYHYGQYLLFDDLQLKKKVHDKKRDAFKRAAPLLEVPMERVEIRSKISRWLAISGRPTGVKKPPCVILLGGLDTTKEDYLTVADHCLRRGLAILAFDGPGQGRNLVEMRWRTDFEKAVIAAVDYVEKRPEIDSNRIGIIGRSMGGCYAPKTAAIDKRIKALVAWGVMYHLQNLAEVPKHTLEGFMFVSNSRRSKRRRRSTIPLICRSMRRTSNARPMVVHGGLDVITPLDNATSLIKDLKCHVETIIWE